MTISPFSKFQILNGNTLKIFASVCMLIDHIGMILLPQVEILRVIGRLSMPIFAFFIAEGCKYTHDKANYLLFMATLGVAMMIVQYAFTGMFFGNILILFSLSILLIYVFQKYKEVIFATKFDLNKQFIWLGLFLLTIIFCIVSCNILRVDYGFYGVMLAFFASLPNFRGIDAGILNRFDNLATRLAFWGLAMLALALDLGGTQIASLIALLPLAMYNGQRGKIRLKYFFYIFYPTHIAILYGIALLIR